MGVCVLRLGHRPARDKRITTHVALDARALGAKGIYVSTKDVELEESVRDVADRFGGDFEIQTGVKWQRRSEGFKGVKVHLTMYGVHIDDAMPRITRAIARAMLVVVGAEKVPPEVYQAGGLQRRRGESAALRSGRTGDIPGPADRRERVAQRTSTARSRCCPARGGRGLSSAMIPLREECIDILREEGCKSSIIEHVCTVHSIAMEMARRSGADLELVSGRGAAARRRPIADAGPIPRLRRGRGSRSGPEAAGSRWSRSSSDTSPRASRRKRPRQLGLPAGTTCRGRSRRRSSATRTTW